MPFQTQKSDAPASGKLGRIPNFEAGAHEISDGLTVNEGATAVGVPIFRDADGALSTGVATAALKFVGITADQSYIVDAGSTTDGKATVKVGGRMPFVRKGTIMVTAPSSVNPTSNVGYVTATGALVVITSANASTATAITGASFEAVAATGVLVPLRLNS